jgi:hypothetical protein
VFTEIRAGTQAVDILENAISAKASGQRIVNAPGNIRRVVAAIADKDCFSRHGMPPLDVPSVFTTPS